MSVLPDLIARSQETPYRPIRKGELLVIASSLVTEIDNLKAALAEATRQSHEAWKVANSIVGVKAYPRMENIIESVCSADCISLDQTVLGRRHVAVIEVRI